MALDFTKISPRARANQIELGKRFGSQDTLEQANRTLAAFETHGARIVPYGFNQDDALRLRDARDLLIEAGVERDVARGDKRANSKASSVAVRQGKNARLRARAVLSSVEEELQDQGLEQAERVVATVLQQTAVASDSSEGLATQLDLLSRVLEHPEVRGLADARGGTETLAALADAALTLRQAQQMTATRPGTAEHTQHLDQLDGIIVRLVRRARKAAIAAARDLTDPALENAFKLDRLYKNRGGVDEAQDEADSEPDAESMEPAQADVG